ncbi:MAG TPA: PKD domain-containing protein [Clostridia bacterium]|nr:PKD domain-containing protein [Clostridia bacterium]
MKTRIGKILTSTMLTLTCSAMHLNACSGEAAGSIQRIPDLGGSVYWVQAMNGVGDLVGFAYLPGDTGARAFRFGDAGLLDLGTLGGGVSQANDINSTGDIVGYSDLANFSGSYGFLFRNGSMTSLGSLGGTWSSAYAINDQGQIVGDAETSDGYLEAFLYSDGQMVGLGTLGGDGSSANAINEQGMVIGDSFTETYDYHAFLYANGTMTDLGDLGGGFSSAAALNAAGLVVGESSTEDFETHAFLYADGVMLDLGTLGGTSSRGIAVNEAGQVIGTSTIFSENTHGFFFDGEVMTDLGSLGGDYTEPVAINSLGEVVGHSLTTNGVLHAFAWRDGVMVDLNSLLDPDSGWVLASAQFINDAGHVVGSGTFNGVASWFRLVPGAQNADPIASAGPNQVVECGSDVVLDASGSSDPDADALTFEWSVDGAVISTEPTYTGSFPLGSHAVVLKVTDPCGASAIASSMVTVVDTTAPVFQSASVTPTVISTPNGKMVPVVCSASATDGCDSAPTIKIIGISSNESTSPGEMQITGDLTAAVAANRDPNGAGRVYTLTLEASDASGNKSTSTVAVTVLKNNGQGPIKPMKAKAKK